MWGCHLRCSMEACISNLCLVCYTCQLNLQSTSQISPLTTFILMLYPPLYLFFCIKDQVLPFVVLLVVWFPFNLHSFILPARFIFHFYHEGKRFHILLPALTVENTTDLLKKIYLCFACMYVCTLGACSAGMQCPQSIENGSRLLGTGGTDSVEPRWEWWGQDPGPRQEGSEMPL